MFLRRGVRNIATFNRELPNVLPINLDRYGQTNIEQAQNTENTAAGATAATSLAFTLLGLFGYRRDEEGGDDSDSDLSNNPQIDGMNPDITGGDRATVGGIGGTSGDTQNRGMGQADGVNEGSVSGGGDSSGKPKPYPIDPSLNAKPITVKQEVYSLSDSDKKAIAELKAKLSSTKVSDNEPELVKTREAIALKNKDFIDALTKVGGEIQDLKERIDMSKKELDALQKGNGFSTPSTDPTILQMSITADLKRLETWNKEYNTIQTKYQDYNAKDTKVTMDRARELALTRLQDSILENPFRQELHLSQLALLGMQEGTTKYKDLKDKIQTLNEKIREFDKAKNQLLNGSGEMQARAAEYILNLSPNANIPRPTMTIEPLTVSNANAQPGYDPKGNQAGILPGINLPGAEVTETEKGHSARPGKKNYFAVDIAAPYGSPYNPVAPGKATVHSNEGYGNHVIVEHEFGVSTVYAHNSEFLIPAGTSVDVDPTTPIARVGNTGNTHSDSYPSGPPVYGGAHIHYEIRINNIKVPVESFDWERYKNEGQSYVSEVLEKRPK